MLEYQERVVQEKYELDKKRLALAEFKSTAKFTLLTPMEQELMNSQAHAMTSYSAILGERITNFK